MQEQQQSLWTKSIIRGCRTAALALLLATLAACDGGSASGSADPVPDPDPQPAPQPEPQPEPSDPDRFDSTAPDPHAGKTYMPSPIIAYTLGNLPVRTSPAPDAPSYVFLAPVRGWIRFPQAALQQEGANKRFPVVVLLHGNHTPLDPSYQGYDYLARNLAEHGYVAVSIDANYINASPGLPDNPDGSGDYSSTSRGQLILGTLDRLRQIDSYGGPGSLDMLRGRIDFDRIGLMGHSRGGQGLANAIKFNTQRDSVTANQLKAQLRATPEVFDEYPSLRTALTPSGNVDDALFESALQQENIVFSPTANTVKPYNIRAGLLLAPTDFYGAVGLSNIALGVVLPSCDGDVMSLQGARTYDNNRFSFDTDSAPRLQVMVRGGNHNYYNTEWKADDNDEAAADPYCDATRTDTPRLSAEDQRRGGLFLVNTFMRHYVGGETAFAPYWNGLAQLPPGACPKEDWPCDARVPLTVQKDATHRQALHTFAYSDSLARNDLGGSVSLKGFDAAAWCNMPYGNFLDGGTCLPESLPGFAYDPREVGGLRSIAEHLQLSWTQPQASVTMALNGISAQAHDTLSLRLAVVRPFGQEIIVTLTDTAGQSASVNASQFSDATYLGPRPPASGTPTIDDAADAPYADGQASQLLNMVGIPLAAFHSVNLGSLSTLQLTLPRDSGSIGLADIQFQTLGRAQR